jgi:hypothetical protein
MDFSNLSFSYLFFYFGLLHPTPNALDYILFAFLYYQVPTDEGLSLVNFSLFSFLAVMATVCHNVLLIIYFEYMYNFLYLSLSKLQLLACVNAIF